MRLGHVELFCRDCAVTRDFYVGVLGFEETEVQGGKFIWLRSDVFELLLRPGSPNGTVKNYSESSLAAVIYCDDLGSLVDRLDEAGIKQGPPDGSPDCITFRDPDGRWIQAVEN